MARRSMLVLVMLALPACRGSSARPPAAKPPPAAAPAPVGPAPTAPGHLARGEVERVLAQGPAWILRRVRVEEVFKDNKFVGWRVLSRPAEWEGIDLEAGDVVLTVNGAVLERPEDLWTAWAALGAANEVRVVLERGGAKRDLVLPIDGAPSAQPATARLEQPPPARKQGGRIKSTIVIEDDETPPDDGPIE